MEGALKELAPLVGRGTELDRIAVRLAQRTPAAFVLAGAPGVGKTRLAFEAARAASGRGFATAEVAASQSGGSIPFGPFAQLLPVGGGATDLLGLLIEASAAIVERAGADKQLLLVVDDAHLLDDGSAALVHQLVRTAACSVVATVRTDARAPEPVTALWKDGLAERVELDALSESEVEEVASGVLDGPIAGASVRRLWELSQGNALYLRELLIGAADSGALGKSGGIWSLKLPLTAPSRLVELIAARLEGVAAETVGAIQLVAAAEPLSLSILEKLSSPAAIEDAERRGFVQLAQDGRRTDVRLAHPLYGEVLRQTLPGYRLRTMSAKLAAAVLETGARRREDLLRLARWQLDAGAREGDPELLGRAARRAIEMFDMGLAERLAERALERGGGVDAALVLGEAKFRSGQLQEAEAVLAAVSERCTTDLERARVASARAYNLYVLIGDADAAAAVIEEALPRISDETARLRLLARRASNRMMEGKPEDALADAAALLASSDDAVVARGTFVSSISLAALGRSAEAVSVGYRGLEAHRRVGKDTQVPEAQLLGIILAHTAAGELAEALSVAETGFEASLAAGDREGYATVRMLGAYALVEQGRLGTACRWFRESASINRELRDVEAIRWCTAGIALAEGMSGHVDEAAEAIAELDGLRAGLLKIYEFDYIERGRAWALVAAGELSRAVELLLDAAAQAATTKLWVAEARLLHDAARLGDPASAAARLETLATIVEGELVATSARHAAGLLRGSSAELDAAGIAFESLGASLLAAEADISAARLFRAEGLQRRAASAGRRAEALMAAVGEARTPGLMLGEEVPLLTKRELEIAGLAAAGASSREIADKLFLSERTIENHLQRVYMKLGLSSRAELGAALRGR
jgi:DNA-binding CsgD family transcriptional regulator